MAFGHRAVFSTQTDVQSLWQYATVLAMENDNYTPQESLLHDLIANQHTLHDTMTQIYEKLDALEAQIDTLATTPKSATEPSEEDMTPVFTNDESNELFAEAREAVARTQKASISFLQRKLRIGYSRAAELIGQLEAEGCIGPAEPGKPRAVFVEPEEPRGRII